MQKSLFLILLFNTKNVINIFYIPLNCILGIATFSQIAEKTEGSSKRSRY